MLSTYVGTLRVVALLAVLAEDGMGCLYCPQRTTKSLPKRERSLLLNVLDNCYNLVALH